VLSTLELALSGLPTWGLGVGCNAVACALLVWRRRVPLVVAPLVGWASTVASLVEPGLSEPAAGIAIVVVACYSCARYRADVWGIAAVAAMLTSAIPQYFLVEADNDITDVFFIGALLVPPFIFGRVARKLDEQTRLLEEQQAVIQEQAAQEERARIARELHDVIAHSISAMVVQISAAQDLVDSDPSRAKDVLDGVASTGRGALAETARLLHLIRDDADELGLEPVPGLADLDRLVADGGVDLERSGDLAALPAAVDVSAYRICQEAVTNGRRYGQGPVSLAVARQNGSVRIKVSNAVGSSASEGGGLGLLGMAERASVLGGTLTHRVREGRFELEAVLPVGDV
jgi:signal transduction histidine kinase